MGSTEQWPNNTTSQPPDCDCYCRGEGRAGVLRRRARVGGDADLLLPRPRALLSEGGEPWGGFLASCSSLPCFGAWFEIAPDLPVLPLGLGRSGQVFRTLSRLPPGHWCLGKFQRRVPASLLFSLENRVPGVILEFQNGWQQEGQGRGREKTLYRSKTSPCG